jgi:hypothetical protein
MMANPGFWFRNLPTLLLGGLAAWMAVTSGAAPVFAQDETAAVETDAAAAPALLGPDELRKLVAPVVFYPDDLLAIVLPAATNPLQIVQAQRLLDKRKSDPKAQPDEEWDPSVLALLNYPEVITKMNADLGWTEDLGNAVIDQQSDVMDMIQQIRAEASAAGYLKSDEKQVVVHEKETVIIQPADPEIIYVPDYDPQVVYVQSYASYPPPYYYPTPYPYYYSPAAAFWTGAFVGAAFSYGFNWGGDDIDINVGGDNINIGGGDNINIGDRGDRGDRVNNRDGDRFNADRQRGVNGQDKMKWNGNKARQKQTTGRKQAAQKRTGTLPANSNRAAKGTRQTGGAGNKAQNRRAGDKKSSNLKNPALGNPSSKRDATKSRNQGSKSMQDRNQRSSSQQRSGSQRSQQRTNQNRSKSQAGAFGGYGSGSKASRSSSRGSSSMRTQRGGGSRGGGRR